MVVYGWNSKVLKEAPFNGHQCPSCKNEATHIVVFGSYFHVFWIPLFPYRKYLRIICDNCQLDQKPKEVSEEVRTLAKQLKSQVRLPFYMYSGVGIITALIIFFTVQGIVDDNKFKNQLNEPQANDIYHLYNAQEPTEFKYYLWKVIDVRGDSVDVSPTSFQYNHDPYTLESEDGFYDVFYSMHKSEILELHETDVLLKVQRGYEASSGFDREIVYEALIEEKNDN